MDWDCGSCQKAFGSEKARDAHVKAVHSERFCDDGHACDACKRVFKSETARDQHRKAKHVSFPCSMCDRDFKSEEALKRHRAALHSKKKKKTVPKMPPSLEGFEGHWVAPKDFHGHKSFGFFKCNNCPKSPSWYSAHAFSKFKQKCKVCYIWNAPIFLWQNSGSVARVKVPNGKLNRPHISELCEACKANACSQGAQESTD
mmetsp:Transcript_6742/g.11887  ORF Transcript_6742/g.11887 Transcript_6742/m.11887 type:complete len:201 (+) Transcript_6742:146-748(+)